MEVSHVALKAPAIRPRGSSIIVFLNKQHHLHSPGPDSANSCKQVCSGKATAVGLGSPSGNAFLLRLQARFPKLLWATVVQLHGKQRGSHGCCMEQCWEKAGPVFSKAASRIAHTHLPVTHMSLYKYPHFAQIQDPCTEWGKPSLLGLLWTIGSSWSKLPRNKAAASSFLPASAKVCASPAKAEHFVVPLKQYRADSSS